MSWYTELFVNEAKYVLPKSANGGGVSEETVSRMVNEYLAENPPVAQVTINGEGPDEKGNFVIDINPSCECDEETIVKAVDDYLTENPPIAKVTINGEGPDENGNFVISTSSNTENNIVGF